MTLILTLAWVQGYEHVLINDNRELGTLTNKKRVHYLDIRAQTVDHVLEDVGGVRLTVVIATELSDQARLYHQLVEQLQGQSSLPGWLVWVQELDNQGEEDLTLGDQEAVILLHEHTDQ